MPTVINEDKEEVLKIKRLSEHAFIPTRGSKLAAGYDLYAAYDYVVEARKSLLVLFLKNAFTTVLTFF